jgi:transposase
VGASSTPCSGLVPGGYPKEISAAQATRILEPAAPSGAVALARAELAAECPADLRHLDAQLRETRKKLAAAVRASRTTLTEVFGVGPVIAGTIIGDASDVARFPGRGHFAACNGTAPVEVSSEKPEGLPLVAARQLADQRRDPHGRDHPDRSQAQPWPGLLRQEDSRMKNL